MKRISVVIVAAMAMSMFGGCAMMEAQKKLESDNAQLKQSLSETTTLLEQANATIKKKDETIKQAEGQQKSLAEKSVAAEKDKAELSKQVSSLTEQLAQSAAEAGRYKRDMERDAVRMESLTKDIDSANARIKALEQQVANLQSELDAAKAAAKAEPIASPSTQPVR